MKISVYGLMGHPVCQSVNRFLKEETAPAPPAPVKKPQICFLWLWKRTLDLKDYNYIFLSYCFFGWRGDLCIKAE